MAEFEFKDLSTISGKNSKFLDIELYSVIDYVAIIHYLGVQQMGWIKVVKKTLDPSQKIKF